MRCLNPDCHNTMSVVGHKTNRTLLKCPRCGCKATEVTRTDQKIPAGVYLEKNSIQIIDKGERI